MMSFPCDPWYQMVASYKNVWKMLWEIVSIPWQQCSQQRCRWWCLCCNKWICWISLIVAAIILLVLYVIYVVSAVMLAFTCWLICIFLFMAEIIGNRGVTDINCFSRAPGDPVDPVPIIKITQPADLASFPDGDVVPIIFVAVASESDGTALTGSAIEWNIVLPTVPNTYQLLGTGAQIAATLPWDPADKARNQLSTFSIRATATGVDGLEANDFVTVSVGHVHII
jgi:hypothetical protein